MPKNRYPVFGTRSQNPAESDVTLFTDLGFLSHEVDQVRLSKGGGKPGFLRGVGVAAAAAYSDLQIDGVLPLSGADRYAVTMLLRSWEACQGSSLLADLGMRGSAASTLRLGLECLFYAAAIWRDPTVASSLVNDEIKRQRLIAETALKHYKEGDVSQDLWNRLNNANLRTAERGLTIESVAAKAGLSKEYAIIYRGLTALGAHPTARSMLDYFGEETESGVRHAVIGPKFGSETESLLTAAIETIAIGQSRLRDRFKGLTFPPPIAIPPRESDDHHHH